MSTSVRNSLGYAGLAPFLGLSVVMLWPDNPYFSSSFIAFISYSIVILCFLCGSLWGQALHHASLPKTSIFLFSNGMTLLAWFSLVLIWSQQPSLAVGLLAINYLIVLFFEKIFIWKNLSSDSLVQQRRYWRLRWHLTQVVVVCHLLVLVALVIR